MLLLLGPGIPSHRCGSSLVICQADVPHTLLLLGGSLPTPGRGGPGPSSGKLGVMMTSSAQSSLIMTDRLRRPVTHPTLPAQSQDSCGFPVARRSGWHLRSRESSQESDSLRNRFELHHHPGQAILHWQLLQDQKSPPDTPRQSCRSPCGLDGNLGGHHVDLTAVLEVTMWT